MVDLPAPALVPGILMLLHMTRSGVGAVAGPMLANWRASREGKARITSALADKEVQRIQAESAAEVLDIASKSQSEALERLLPSSAEPQHRIEITPQQIAHFIEFQGRKRLTNLEAVVSGAADDIGDKEVPYHEPDPDWAARFFGYAQDVSSEEMQQLWAKILAGEVETPGRTSLRTLSTLRDMTQQEAREFSDLMRFRISDYVLGACADKIIGNRFATIMLTLGNAGLVHSSMEASTIITLPDSGIIDREHHGHLLRIEGPPGTELNLFFLGEVPLTPPGRELAVFCKHEPDLEYLRCFARFLESNGCSLKIAPLASVALGGPTRFDPGALLAL